MCAIGIICSLGFVNYYLNVFTFSCRRDAPEASELRRRSRNWGPLRRSLSSWSDWREVLASRSFSHVVSVSFSFGRHRYADLWRPWNTILMRSLLPLISLLCLTSDLRCSFVRRKRLFGEIAYNIIISRICQIRNIYAVNLPNIKKFKIAEC